jgi:hypothetical protein
LWLTATPESHTDTHFFHTLTHTHSHTLTPLAHTQTPQRSAVGDGSTPDVKIRRYAAKGGHRETGPDSTSFFFRCVFPPKSCDWLPGTVKK